MSIVTDQVGQIIRRLRRAPADPLLEAFRRGEEIADRRAHLIRWARDGSMSYAEAERLVSDEELDDICDFLLDSDPGAETRHAEAVAEAERDGWLSAGSVWEDGGTRARAGSRICRQVI